MHRNPGPAAGRRTAPSIEADDRVRALTDADHFFELSHDIVCTSTFDGHFERINSRWEQLLGWTLSDLRSRPYLDFVHPDDHESTVAAGERLREGGMLASFQNRWRTKAGEWRWLEWSAAADPERGLIHSSARDITDRKRLIEGLREAEDRFRKAFDEAPIGMALVSPEGRFMRVNRALCEIVGYGERELLALTFQEITHADDLDGDLAQVERMLAGEIRSYRMQKRYLTRAGEIVWVSLSVSLVRDDDGEPLYFISQIEDITERKRSERALREAEERFRRAFADAGTGMALVGVQGDARGRFLDVNEALCRVTGFTREQLLGRDFIELTHPDDREASAEGVERLMRGEQGSFQAEKRILHADGRAVWVSLSTSVVRAPDGTPLYRVAQLQDVSERKRVEGELAHLADHDALTGLFNRRRLEHELERELSAALRYETGGALLLLDLDNFKEVNDTLGHHAGDDLLVRVAVAARERLRESDIIGRLGGDEFAVILPHADEAGARQVAEALLEAIREQGGDLDSTGSASIGIAMFRASSRRASAEALLIEADVAMYRAKEAGRDRIEVYSALPVAGSSEEEG